MDHLKIDFCDFWTGFNKEDNLLINLLRHNYKVEISANPELLIYSCYSFNHLKYSCYKVFYTGENVRPNFIDCDFSLTYCYSNYNNRNLRLPLYRWRGDLENLILPKDSSAIFQQKTKFCCMLVSNPHGKERNEFYEKLSKYKKVDSGGSYRNNIGGRVEDKDAFIKSYKFVLSFENASTEGYTSEKLIEPLLANSLPVYWGNPRIEKDFNSKSFINVHQYSSFQKVIEEIIRIDNNDNAYFEYLNQPYFKNNAVPKELNYDVIANELCAGIERIKLHKPISSIKKNKILQRVNKYRKIINSKLTQKPHCYC